MAHAIIVKGQMASENVSSLLRSVTVAADTDNGAQVVIGAQNADGTYAVAAPTSVTTQKVAVIEDPVLVKTGGYFIGDQDPSKYYIEANRSQPARARILMVGDVIRQLSIDGFTAAPTVGNYAVPVNGSTKLAPAADLTGNTLVAYKVVKRHDIAVGQSFIEAYKLEVIKA